MSGARLSSKLCIVACFAALGCGGLTLAPGSLPCSKGNESCPSGYVCLADLRCYPNGWDASVVSMKDAATEAGDHAMTGVDAPQDVDAPQAVDAPSAEAGGGNCPVLADPSGGVVVATALTSGSTATYSCQIGSQVVGTAMRTCGGGAWSGTAPTCALEDCGALVAPSKGTITAPKTTYGSVATYGCQAGYGPSGSETRTCQLDGTWSGSQPTCVVANCPALPGPAGGSVVATTLTYGSMATYACNSGYTLAGVTSRTCDPDGTWSGAAPMCTIKDCGALVAPTNGTDSVTATTYGSTATFTCNTGYSLSASASITCQTDGTWSAIVPSCAIKDCGALTAPTNGSVSALVTTYGSSATYACTNGFGLSGGATRTCGSDGKWTGAAPSCALVDCGTLAAPANGLVTAPTTTFGSTATYSCATGYGPSGSATRTCQANGTWTGAAPSCVIANCPALAGPSGGSVSAPTLTYGSTATYSCGTGYTLAGTPTRSCLSSGAWSGTAPTCTIADCGALVAPTNGAVSAAVTTYGSNATYTCNAGYAASSSVTRTCQASGTWSGTAPTCSIISCPTLAGPTNGSVSAPVPPTYGSTATYSCNASSGYLLSGSSTQTCQANGTWSGTAPTCTLKDCGPLTAPTNGSVSAPTTTFGATATYTCITGYGPSGSSTRTCGSSGWSGVAPMCIIANCPALSNPVGGTVSANTLTYGSIASYMCNSGYLLNGATTLTCQANGSWSGTPPTCVPKDCLAPGAPTNGKVVYGATTYPSTASYSCNPGYTLSGGTTRACQSDGSWSGSVPSCLPVDCGAPSAIANGTVSAPTTTLGFTATYSCNPNFVFSGATPTRTCLSSGSWSTPIPACVDICSLGQTGNASHCCTDAVCSGTTPMCNTTSHACSQRGAGGACSGSSECATGPCLGGFCCASTVPCSNTNCYGCAPSTGSCTPLPAKTSCGTLQGLGGPGIGTDVALYCDGAGSCKAPTIGCIGSTGSTPCDLSLNVCCYYLSSDTGCIDIPEEDFCNDPVMSSKYQGMSCGAAADCPLGMICCSQSVNAQVLYWSTCIPNVPNACSGLGTILP